MKSIERNIFSFLVIAVLAPVCFAQAASDDGPGLSVSGLKDEVIVRRDGRSIPYIEAKNDSDLYFAQGYETARDRLWQMDLLRRVARGRLAELFGPAVVDQDIRWRRYGFASVAEKSIEVMDSGLRTALEDYARGVNAYIATLDSKTLPVEFSILKYEPEPWKPTDTMMIGFILSEALSTTWYQDVYEYQLQALPKEKREAILNIRDPRDVLLFGKDMESASAAPLPVVFDPQTATALAEFAIRDERLRKESLELVGLYAPGLAASNNWVISGKRTLDGKAILANDPHLRPAAPGIWYLTHLSVPGHTVSGVTFPGVPGIVLGHNANFAWGATNVGPDVQDIYFEEFNDKGEYRTPEGWKKAEIRKETILMRKGLGPETEPREIEVIVTRNGPVFGEVDGKKYSLKWTAFEPTNEIFGAFFRLNRAKGWDGFKNALRSYGGPMQNFVYADVEGNIGWYTASNVPIRKKGFGAMPYDGSTSDGDWIGTIPFEELPHLYNPPEGFIVTANQRIAGTSYKYRQFTRQFAPPWRARRIYDLIRANSKITMNDVSDIQHDVFNIPLSELAREIVKRGAASSRTIQLLQGWDGRMTAESKAAPTIDEIRKCVSRRIALENKPARPGDIADNILGPAYAASDSKWLPDQFESWDEMFRSCDVKWNGETGGALWGAVNVADFNHPLSAAPLIGGRFKVSYTNVDGSGQTPNVGSLVSMRHISKPGSWEETRFVIPLGQSGIPGSPHWTDQFDQWRTGGPALFPFEAKSVMKAAETSLKMVPEKKAASN